MNRAYDGLEGVGAPNTLEYLEVSSLFLDDKGPSHTQILAASLRDFARMTFVSSF
jgi:hypothetical protein